MANINERAELHKTIWQIANDLRGSVDGWDFKNYVLGFLFYRFISEDQTAHLNRLEAEAGNEGFDYARDVTDDDIDSVIQLPANLFFGVGIATCIIVLKKSKADNSVLFIDASKDCVKDGNKNKLTSENIDTIFNTYVGRRDVDYKSRLVNNKDILANDCNLSVSSYVKQEDTREQIDIAEVNTKLASLIAEGNELNQKIEAIVKELEG